MTTDEDDNLLFLPNTTKWLLMHKKLTNEDEEKIRKYNFRKTIRKIFRESNEMKERRITDIAEQRTSKANQPHKVVVIGNELVYLTNPP